MFWSYKMSRCSDPVGGPCSGPVGGPIIKIIMDFI